MRMLPRRAGLGRRSASFPPRAYPVESEARNVVIRAPQTKIDVPKTGAMIRLPAISRPMRAAPERKTTV